MKSQVSNAITALQDSPFGRAFRKVYAFLVQIVLKRFIIPLVLILFYFIGVGLTSVFIRLFRPKLLRASEQNSGSYWLSATGYESDEEKCLRQS